MKDGWRYSSKIGLVSEHKSYEELSKMITGLKVSSGEGEAIIGMKIVDF
jgi:hypothetical protein